MSKKFFIKNDNIELNQNLLIENEEFSHIFQVMRFKVGEELILCNGNGLDYFACVLEINKKNAIVKIIDAQKNENEPNIQLDLFQALIKGDKLEYITQKITELGVTNMFLFEQEHSIVKENTTKIDRLNKISIEAVKQCNRAKQINIQLIKFNQMLEMLKNYDLVILAYEKSIKTDLIQNLLKTEHKKIAVIIGSEGGFTEDEISKIECLSNVNEISLGKRVLRADTASIGLIATISFLTNN